MRPLRFLLTLSTFVLAFVLTLLLSPWRQEAQVSISDNSGLTTFFNWRTPSSLFPPSAIISLTDDNSTFFLARPAAFGPVLPTKSLSGQLWVGSGFGEDHLGADAEGELGCSDVPGWGDGVYGVPTAMGLKKVTEDASILTGMSKGLTGGKAKRSQVEEGMGAKEKDTDGKDGTDDHLHHPLPASDGLKTNGRPAGTTRRPTHADIQSLQESAEIAGKVVLLSRGGCGFLEKVKWVQRRGGVALIVGDDIRGGPLVTMYARGDTSNVTIPSLFTSHTTAHLLSSLIPSGGAIDDVTVEDAARLGLAFGDKSSKTEQKEVDDGPNFTATTAAVKATPKSNSRTKDGENPSPLRDREAPLEEEEASKASWLQSLFSSRSVSSGPGDSRRPPSSGNIEWIQQEEFVEDEDEGPSTSTRIIRPTAASKQGDDFVIGVQDWRDPDLVAAQKEEASSSAAAAQDTKAPGWKSLIASGRNRHGKSRHGGVDLVTSGEELMQGDEESTEEPEEGWLSWLIHSDDDEKDDHQAMDEPTISKDENRHTVHDQPTHLYQPTSKSTSDHTGLWVTITPTSMSSSPFFDTLLVLVVSPLVTLTVVYALLLLRSRLRRRRWRAPKSVVERLPVRTYQTMPSNTSSGTSPTTSSISSPTGTNATTPLLPSSPRAITSRPHSRTTSDVGASASVPSVAEPSLEQIEEKRAAGLAEWRRRYGGKQRECVVCLEEYVDGVSRVMSLPCGHEFHVECITPWLTTRRRTCPICKGDVVRSLSRHGGSNTTTDASASTTGPAVLEPYYDDDGPDEVQEEAALARNEDPAAARPVLSREEEAFADLEGGRRR
ncbi:hypothetical protein MBLNU230_g6722t1 [Neophaeotheca triangularis]